MIVGRVVDFDIESREIIIRAPCSVEDWTRKKYEQCDVDLHDGRLISPQQRGKIRALIADICEWAGYRYKDEQDNVHEALKGRYCALSGTKEFSLSDCDMTIARGYISSIIDFVLANDIPCLDSLLARADDIDAYLYACLWHRKCCISGKKADVHHIDAIGMGRNRDKICHIGLEAIALSRDLHMEAERIGWQTFRRKYHIYGIKIDKALADHLNLGRKRTRVSEGAIWNNAKTI